MKFKNYKNSHTGDNRIYSHSDMTNMTVGDFLNKKLELLAQYRVLGVPTDKELQASSNVVYVHAYTREDGTEVKAHYRSKPDGGVNNNFSTESLTGGASELTDKTTPTLNGSVEVNKKLYPDEIAGVKRGEPKTFEQMIQQGVNPNYMSEKDENGDYSNNCQCCTIAAELFIRGYNVEAGPYSTPEAKELGNTSKSGYLDPKTGEECVPNIIFTNEINCYDYLNQHVKQGERYELTFNTPSESGNAEYDIEHENDGHVVLITRNEHNKILYYDPQDGKCFEGNDVKKYLNTWFQYEHTIVAPPRILRIDNKALNMKYVNAVVKKRDSK